MHIFPHFISIIFIECLLQISHSAKCVLSVWQNFHKCLKWKKTPLYFLKHLTSLFLRILFKKNGNYYLIKLGVGQQEIETENMSFQDFFVIKDPLHQMNPFPGIKLNEHIKNNGSTKAPSSSQYIWKYIRTIVFSLDQKSESLCFLR